MPEIPKITIEKPKKEKTREQVLEMSPKELVDYFTELEERGELQSFLEKAIEDDALIAQLSYWEKWLEKDHRKLVDQVVEKKKKMYPGESDSLPLELEKKFLPEELELIMKNVGAIQLTFGCSKSCAFCGFDAVPGVREHIPYSQIANLFQKYGDLFKERRFDFPLLYWASEPSDYSTQEGLQDMTYEDIHQLAKEYTGITPHITSRETKDIEWLKFLESVGGMARVSVYGLSEQRVLGVEDVTGEWVRKVGKGDIQRKGIGKTILGEKSMIGRMGIGSFDGTLITPRGLYNVIQVPVSEKYPQGQIVVPIEKVREEGRKIKIGDSVSDLMLYAVVIHMRRKGRISGSVFPDLLVRVGDKYYNIALDDNYKISEVIENEVTMPRNQLREEELSIQNDKDVTKEQCDKKLTEIREKIQLLRIKEQLIMKRIIQKHTLLDQYKIDPIDLERFRIQVKMEAPNKLPYLVIEDSAGGFDRMGMGAKVEYVSEESAEIEKHWDIGSVISNEDVIDKLGRKFYFKVKLGKKLVFKEKMRGEQPEEVKEINSFSEDEQENIDNFIKKWISGNENLSELAKEFLILYARSTKTFSDKVRNNNIIKLSLLWAGAAVISRRGEEDQIVFFDCSIGGK
ncbi:MAG TPA: hypothetical protein VMX18_02915 [Candidatus Bipolaricaulota bacterium]|nr:hypothetical protein [Candidatus Bipolaricaulota bacterium]